jgi:hypothetical protein
MLLADFSRNCYFPCGACEEEGEDGYNAVSKLIRRYDFLLRKPTMSFQALVIGNKYYGKRHAIQKLISNFIFFI